jgi:HPt (histidine-containing phosphotransfer) domain-containing protein
MYKVEIELGGWDETITINTSDFSKIALLAEFIELQQESDWGAEEDLIFTDEDGVTWVYDEELDEWVEAEEDEEDEEDYE